MKYALFTGLLALAGVHAKSTSHLGDVLVENLHSVPEGWKEVGVPAQSRKLHFRIAVRSVSTKMLFSCIQVDLVFTCEHVPCPRARLRVFQVSLANPP